MAFPPIVYLRSALGAVFVLFLPGYSFIKALFPSKFPLVIKTNSEELDNVERVALSLGMSLALVPIVGLILNYTPLGHKTNSHSAQPARSNSDLCNCGDNP